MKYKCRKCGDVVEATVKPKSCAKGCKQAGFDIVADAPAPEKRDISSVPEWDNAATAPIDPVSGQTLNGLGGRHGLPTADCLNALYAKVSLPGGGTDSNSIYFSAFTANYSQAAKLTVKATLADNKPLKKTGLGASDCAERLLWKDIQGKLDATAAPYLGIGQTIRPCKLCTARYSALAASRSMTILVCFEKGYDALPGNSWLVFSPSGGGTAYSG